MGKNEAGHIINQDKVKVDINNSGIDRGNKLSSESSDISNNNITISFEKNKNKKSKAKKKQEEVFNLTDKGGYELVLGSNSVPANNEVYPY